MICKVLVETLADTTRPGWRERRAMNAAAAGDPQMILRGANLGLLTFGGRASRKRRRVVRSPGDSVPLPDLHEFG